LTPPNTPTPAALITVDRADPGDETFRRFRYQATHAATLAAGLLDPDSEILEVYCEQYEDVLVRLRSGRLRGIQVKTRSDGAEALKATDESILDALVRFLELDLTHVDVFDGFTIATNGAFDRSGKGYGNLQVVTDEARAHIADAAVPARRRAD
jgi:Cap4 dsDNA endonuclease